MTTTNEQYNKLIASWKTPAQIQEAINTKYWVDSKEAKQTSSFISSQTPQQEVNVLTPTQLQTKNLGTTSTTQNLIQTPQQTKIQGVTTKAVTEDKNLASLNKLYEKWYTTEQIKTQLWKTYWVNSTEYNKALWYLKTDTENKIKEEVPRKDITSNITSDIFKQNKDQLLDTRWWELEKFKTDGVNQVWENFTKSSDILKSNNASLLNLYWINTDWTVDTTNKNWLAFQIEQRRKDYEDLQNKEFSKLKSTKYQSILWNIRSQLASRWVDVSKVPPEQLIALSDRVWQAAVTDVYNAKEKVINNIQSYSDNAINQINLLREKWLVSTNEANKQIEALRQTAEWQISTINKEYVNSMLWLAEWKANETEANKTNVLNTITTLWTQLWLSGTSLWVLNSYMWKYNTPQEAYQAILKDLSNTNSQLYKSLKSQEEAAAAQQAFKNQLEQLKISSSWSSWVFNPTENQWKALSILWLTTDDITTKNDFLRLQTAIMAWDNQTASQIAGKNLTKTQINDAIKFLHWWIQPISEINNNPTTTTLPNENDIDWQDVARKYYKNDNMSYWPEAINQVKLIYRSQFTPSNNGEKKNNWWVTVATTNPVASDSLSFIKKWEWFRDKAYQDSAWIWTIGYGFTRNPDWTPVKKWDTMSQSEADKRLVQEINNRQNYKNFLTTTLTPQQEAALSSFEFNLWSNIWNSTGKWIIDALNKWEIEKAKNILLAHNKAKVNWQLTEIKWLTNRRSEEAKLLLS